MVIEIQTFRLHDGVDEAAFLSADARMQTEFVYAQAGVMRRTTARGEDGEWLVFTLWGSAADADAAAGNRTKDAAAVAFGALIDPESVRTSRYATLD